MSKCSALSSLLFFRLHMVISFCEFGPELKQPETNKNYYMYSPTICSTDLLELTKDTSHLIEKVENLILAWCQDHGWSKEKRVCQCMTTYRFRHKFCFLSAYNFPSEILNMDNIVKVMLFNGWVHQLTHIACRASHQQWRPWIEVVVAKPVENSNTCLKWNQDTCALESLLKRKKYLLTKKVRRISTSTRSGRT